jgi:hypothetical protein
VAQNEFFFVIKSEKEKNLFTFDFVRDTGLLTDKLSRHLIEFSKAN